MKNDLSFNSPRAFERRGRGRIPDAFEAGVDAASRALAGGERGREAERRQDRQQKQRAGRRRLHRVEVRSRVRGANYDAAARPLVGEGCA